MRYATIHCDTCGTEIPAGTRYVCVVRQVERVERRWFRWAVSVINADVQDVWCLDCASRPAEV